MSEFFTHGDIRNSQVWDKVKDQLTETDKQNFLSLYHLESDDPIIQCRKAELHIMMGTDEDDIKAFELLKSNTEALAFGLHAKLLSAINDEDGLKTLLQKSFPECAKQSDFEGAIHFERAKARLNYIKGENEQYLLNSLRAQGFVDYLRLDYMSKVITSDLLGAYRHLGLQGQSLEFINTGNPRLNSDFLFTQFRNQLIQSRFDEIESSTLANRFKQLADALKAKQEKRYSFALLKARDLHFPESEFQVHTLLLRLELFGRTNDYAYTLPKDCLEGIQELLSQLEFRLEVLQDCAKLYPLGVVLAGLDVEIAVVKDQTYRDGVHYLHEVHTIPSVARKLLIQDDLENTWVSKMMDKTHRYRLNQKLRPLNLTVNNLIAEALIDKAKAQLREVL